MWARRQHSSNGWDSGRERTMTPSPWNGIGGSQNLASFGVRENRFAPKCAIYQLCDLTRVSSPLWPQTEIILELWRGLIRGGNESTEECPAHHWCRMKSV